MPQKVPERLERRCLAAADLTTKVGSVGRCRSLPAWILAQLPPQETPVTCYTFTRILYVLIHSIFTPGSRGFPWSKHFKLSPTNPSRAECRRCATVLVRDAGVARKHLSSTHNIHVALVNKRRTKLQPRKTESSLRKQLHAEPPPPPVSPGTSGAPTPPRTADLRRPLPSGHVFVPETPSPGRPPPQPMQHSPSTTLSPAPSPQPAAVASSSLPTLDGGVARFSNIRLEFPQHNGRLRLPAVRSRSSQPPAAPPPSASAPAAAPRRPPSPSPLPAAASRAASSEGDVPDSPCASMASFL